jgi:hypothetical protein
MQLKRYHQWIAIALATIVVVLIVFVLILKAQKHADSTQNPTPTPSASVTTSDMPTATPSVAPSASATPSPTSSNASSTDHKALAEAAYKNKSYATAISEFKLAINATTSASDLSTLWYELGNAYRDNADAANALKAYDKAISYNKLLGDAYLNKAAVQWSQSAKDDAIATLQAGIDVNASRKTDLQNTLDVYKALNQ